jgi:hypothetical protein
MSYLLDYLAITSMFVVGIGIRRYLDETERWYALIGERWTIPEWTVLGGVKLFLGSLFWPYILWGGVCSLTIDVVTLVFNIVWKVYERTHR